MFDLRSAFKGIRHMKFPHGKVNYAIRFKRYGRFGFHFWTPVYHEGRGPYVSLILWFVAFFRGY